ncbi:hypothetical protein [Moorena producens]|uniref:hypothetical protein n=1 Tax=Moorena producens TaxID=1155739 RepID=UPI003C721DD8
MSSLDFFQKSGIGNREQGKVGKTALDRWIAASLLPTPDSRFPTLDSRLPKPPEMISEDKEKSKTQNNCSNCNNQ